jgi:hypothetical protein
MVMSLLGPGIKPAECGRVNQKTGYNQASEAVMKLALILLAAIATTAPSTQPTSPAIQALSQTGDPSAAVEAYARGIAANPNDVDLQQAYVRHMVDLGAPEMADAQAHDLIKRHVADSSALGVAAYMDASRGQTPAAIHNLNIAIAQKPDDPFLLRTAAQIVVWYDTSLDRSSLSKDDVAGVETLRAAGKDKTEFDDAYRMAFSARQHEREAPSTQPTYTPPAASASEPVYIAPPTSYYYQPYYSAPYVSSGYTPYYYPYWGYGYGYWGSSIIVVRDCDFHHHHHRGWDNNRWDSNNNFDRRGIVGPMPANSLLDRSAGSIPRTTGRSGISSSGNRTILRYDTPRISITPTPSPSPAPAPRPSAASPRQTTPMRQTPTPKYDTPAPVAPAPARSAPARSAPARSSGSGNSGPRR